MREFIKQMLRETLLNEGKQVGTIYHYTSIINGINIVESGLLSGHPEKFKNSQRMVFCVSTTRDKNFWNIIRHVDSRLEIRLNLDGDAISQRYQIKPFNYFTTGTRSDNPEHVESEEIIIIPKGQPEYFEFKNYLIDITCDLNVLQRKHATAYTTEDEEVQPMLPILQALLKLAYSCKENGYKLSVIPNAQLYNNYELAPIIDQIIKYSK